MTTLKNKLKTKVIYDFVYRRNGNLGELINDHIQRWEALGWKYLSIHIFVDQNLDNTTYDFVIVFQK
jgi:hypothetical protein